jgi:hypothetical protein
MSSGLCRKQTPAQNIKTPTADEAYATLAVGVFIFRGTAGSPVFASQNNFIF